MVLSWPRLVLAMVRVTRLRSGSGTAKKPNRQVLAGCYPDRTYIRGFLAGFGTERGSNCMVPTTLAPIKYLSSDRIMT